jgi:S1-C subfamily serine protease
MTEQVLSLGGLAAGAVLGGRLVPALAGDRIPGEWLPLAALGGALVGAILVQSLLLRLAAPLRLAVRRGPLRPVDAGGGLIVGGALGLAVAWLVASVLVYQAGDRAGSAVREHVQRSAILTRALETVPPDRLISALARLDPLPLVPLAPEALPPPDESVLAEPQAAAARGRVVQIRGRACGIGLSGSGWVVGTDLIATNAHVVAGIPDPEVLIPDGRRLTGTPVYMDRADDVALVRVDGLGLRPLELGDAPPRATSVVLMGYPGGGALRAEAATAGPESAVLAPGIDGGRHLRSIVTVRGTLGAGSSGGPVVDRGGEVVAMIFGGTPGRDATAAVPPDEIRDGLAAALRPVDPGACVA